MNIENVERAVMERVLTIAPGIASAEVILTHPISLPEEAQGEAYFGLVVIGAGKELPGATIQTRGIRGSRSNRTVRPVHAKLWKHRGCVAKQFDN